MHSGARLIGISEVGHVEGTTDHGWGSTAQEGVTLQLSTQTVDLMSGQAKMKEDVSLVSASMQLVVNLITSSVKTLQNVWGLPDAAVSGDLSAATPSAERLSISSGNLGTQERKLYVLGPGPVGTRRLEVARARVSSLGNLQFAANAYQTPNATWEVLNPRTGSPLTITDSV